jgi:hypothetical protein
VSYLIDMATAANEAAAKAHAKGLAGPPPMLNSPVPPSRLASSRRPGEPERREAARVPTPPRTVRDIEPPKVAQ